MVILKETVKVVKIEEILHRDYYLYHSLTLPALYESVNKCLEVEADIRLNSEDYLLMYLQDGEEEGGWNLKTETGINYFLKFKKAWIRRDIFLEWCKNTEHKGIADLYKEYVLLKEKFLFYLSGDIQVVKYLARSVVKNKVRFLFNILCVGDKYASFFLDTLFARLVIGKYYEKAVCLGFSDFWFSTEVFFTYKTHIYLDDDDIVFSNHFSYYDLFALLDVLYSSLKKYRAVILRSEKKLLQEMDINLNIYKSYMYKLYIECKLFDNLEKISEFLYRHNKKNNLKYNDDNF